MAIFEVNTVVDQVLALLPAVVAGACVGLLTRGAVITWNAIRRRDHAD